MKCLILLLYVTYYIINYIIFPKSPSSCHKKIRMILNILFLCAKMWMHDCRVTIRNQLIEYCFFKIPLNHQPKKFMATCMFIKTLEESTLLPSSYPHLLISAIFQFTCHMERDGMYLLSFAFSY